MSADRDGLTEAARIELERIEDSGDTQGLTWRVDAMLADRTRLVREQERAARWGRIVALEDLRSEALYLRGRLSDPQYGDTGQQVLLDRAVMHRVLAAIEVLG